MKRKLIWTVPVLEDFERQIKYLGDKSPAAARRLVQNVFSRIIVLKNFPEIGRPIGEYEKAREKVEYRIALESIPATDLKLKELLIDNYVFMYGFNESEVVILFVKHQKQDDY